MSSYTEGQTHLLLNSLEAKGWSAGDLTKLGQAKPEQHQAIRDVLDSRAVINYPQHLIDCDAAPFWPMGYSVNKHIKGGQFEWNPARVRLYLDESQQPGNIIQGHRLHKELEGQPVLNACVMDWLLANPQLIPGEWEGIRVFFWGTVYCSSNGYLCVRCLYRDGSGWDWCFRYLDQGFNSFNPAAVLASI